MNQRAAIASVTVGCCVLLHGCMIATPAFEPPDPAEALTLQADFTRDPTDLTTALSLAAAHFQSGDLESGRDVLQTTHAAVPGDATVLAVLGIAEDELGNYLAADDHYAAFLATAPYDPRADMVLARKDIIAAQTWGLRAEQDLALTPAPSMGDSDGDSIAVLPFQYDANVPGVAALATGLADLVSADFARAGESVTDPRATRALARAADVDPTSNLTLGDITRFGGLHRARAVLSARIVVGTDGAPAINAILVTASSDGSTSSVTPIVVEGSDLLTLQKRLAIEVLFAWRGGVTPVVAEQVVAREVSVIDAASAYGVGLTHSDAGRHADAQQAYARAAALDPAFDRAREASQRAGLAGSMLAVPLSASTVEAARIGELQRTVIAVRNRSGSFGRGTADLGAVDGGSAVAEVFGQDLLGGSTLFSFFLTLSGGGQ